MAAQRSERGVLGASETPAEGDLPGGPTAFPREECADPNSEDASLS